jgi:two-component system, NarL family, invasion response regulator UvrY
MSRVLVIDDHPIVLQGVRQLLEDAGVNQIVQARNLADGFRLYRTQKPDVIIVDLAMRTGALGGLSFIRRLRLHDQQTPILVLTMHSDPLIVSRALEVGATGYVLKDTSSDEVLKAFQRVRENRPYLSHDLASEVAFMEARGTTNPLRRMTVRAADACAGRRRQALRSDRRESARELQDRGQHLHAAQGQTRRAHAPRADAHRHPAPALRDGESSARLVTNFLNRRAMLLEACRPSRLRSNNP